MEEIYKKDLGEIMLEFCINGMSTHDTEWVDVDIKITSSVITYNLKDWECDGEIFMREDVSYVVQLMDRWLQGDIATIEEYEAIEPDLLLKFYPGEERRIDFCICLQTKEFAFTNNYIVLPLCGKNAIEFVKYWKVMDLRL